MKYSKSYRGVVVEKNKEWLNVEVRTTHIVYPDKITKRLRNGTSTY
jgi:hypothetical protein